MTNGDSEPMTRRDVYEDLDHSLSQLEGDIFTFLRREGLSDHDMELGHLVLRLVSKTQMVSVLLSTLERYVAWLAKEGSEKEASGADLLEELSVLRRFLEGPEGLHKQ